MVENYYQDLWNKAEKLGIRRKAIGAALFGVEKYRQIYAQGRITPRMKQRYQEIDRIICELAKRK